MNLMNCVRTQSHARAIHVVPVYFGDPYTDPTTRRIVCSGIWSRRTRILVRKCTRRGDA